MTLYKQLYRSPLGDLSLVLDAQALHGIWFVGQAHFEAGLVKSPVEKKTDLLARVLDRLDQYFQTGQADFGEIPLADRGTAFQKRVWSYLKEISTGQTVTYGQLAKALNVNSAQAIGGAVGRNPWSILIPCHRVLGSQGQLTGYAAGLERKIWLLKHEGVVFSEQKFSCNDTNHEEK